MSTAFFELAWELLKEDCFSKDFLLKLIKYACDLDPQEFEAGCLNGHGAS